MNTIREIVDTFCGHYLTEFIHFGDFELAKRNEKPPGSFFIHAGRWRWKVKLPGSDKRQNIKISSPGSQTGLRVLDNRANEKTAWSIAWRIWEKASKQSESTITDTLTVAGLAHRYVQHCKNYYPDRTTSKQTSETDMLCLGIRLLLTKYA